jgi:hypothetical protein
LSFWPPTRNKLFVVAWPFALNCHFKRSHLHRHGPESSHQAELAAVALGSPSISSWTRSCRFCSMSPDERRSGGDGQRLWTPAICNVIDGEFLSDTGDQPGPCEGFPKAPLDGISPWVQRWKM